MNRFESGIRVSASLAVVLASACGGGGDGPADVADPPPDLTGTYDLTSFSSAVLTSGATLTPPAVSGTLVLQQSPANGAEAVGTFNFEVRVPDGQGNTQVVADEGNYRVRADGSWEQGGSLVQGIGTFSFSGSTLTMRVTEPALNASTSVWQRR